MFTVPLSNYKLRDILIGVVSVISVIVVLSYFLFFSRSSPSYITAKVGKGDLKVTISATGTIEPEESIDVGAQVAGIILSFGKDKNGATVDYGSEVDAGMVLAQIDDSLYQSDLLRDKAALEAAKANLGQAEAKYSQAERNWVRVEKVSKTNALSPTDYDAYKAAYEEGLANVAVAQAAIKQAEAALDRSQRNVDYCVIRSPVNGVIIDRKVNIGQTVVSSLNAPSLFLIAKDLKRMEVWVSVNEADIGKVHEGQEVSFTVDALPAETFKGKVGKIRLNASMTQNVVTYIVEVSADNSQGKLLPYLTANANFLVSDYHDVLLVPNSALRWAPLSGTPKENENRETGTVWRKKASFGIAPVSVEIIATDGVNTAVRTDGLKPDDEVVVSEVTTAEGGRGAPQGTTNPFAPTFNRGGRH